MTSNDVANNEIEIVENVEESAGDDDACVEDSAEDFQQEQEQKTPTRGQKSAARCEEEEILAVVEAILFASDSPIPQSKIAAIADLPGRSVKKAVGQLNERYETRTAAFRIQEIAGGLQMLTLPQYNDVLKRMLTVKKDSRLTQPTMETLAIVAYRQPILRADVEAIRGVASGEVLRGLLEKGLVKIVGRAEVIGRPMLYGTTKRFLETFGLGSLDDLPRSEDLRQPAAPPENAAAESEPDNDDADQPDDEPECAA